MWFFIFDQTLIAELIQKVHYWSDLTEILTCGPYALP